MSGEWQLRRTGLRKRQLLLKVYENLNDLGKRGMNPLEVAKFLKLNLKKLELQYTTKQLSGVISQLKAFQE